MRELVRGYAAATLETAERNGHLDSVETDLGVLITALNQSDVLRRVLTDPSVPAFQRRAVVADLMKGKAVAEAADLAAFVVGSERAGEVENALGHVRLLAAEARARAGSKGPSPAEPPGTRSAVRSRIGGYADRVLAEITDLTQVDAIEDELFGFARAVEAHPELRRSLIDPGLPLAVRTAVLGDVLKGRTRPETERMLSYVLRAGHIRDLVSLLDWLVEMAAAERGRRVAEVRSISDLDSSQREQLAAALTRSVGRPVEVRVVTDSELIGGMVVSIGDMVIDGTVRHRLDMLREALTAPGASGALGALGSPAA